MKRALRQSNSRWRATLRVVEVPTLTKGEQVSDAIRDALSGRRQTEVAAAVELSWPQWQRRMSGNVPWRAEEVRAIARVLGVPIEQLMGDS